MDLKIIHIFQTLIESSKEMLKEIGLENLRRFTCRNTRRIKVKSSLNLPKPFESEYELKRAIQIKF